MKPLNFALLAINLIYLNPHWSAADSTSEAFFSSAQDEILRFQNTETGPRSVSSKYLFLESRQSQSHWWQNELSGSSVSLSSLLQAGLEIEFLMGVSTPSGATQEQLNRQKAQITEMIRDLGQEEEFKNIIAKINELPKRSIISEKLIRHFEKITQDTEETERSIHRTPQKFTKALEAFVLEAEQVEQEVRNAAQHADIREIMNQIAELQHIRVPANLAELGLSLQIQMASLKNQLLQQYYQETHGEFEVWTNQTRKSALIGIYENLIQKIKSAQNSMNSFYGGSSLSRDEQKEILEAYQYAQKVGHHIDEGQAAKTAVRAAFHLLTITILAFSPYETSAWGRQVGVLAFVAIAGAFLEMYAMGADQGHPWMNYGLTGLVTANFILAARVSESAMNLKKFTYSVGGLLVLATAVGIVAATGDNSFNRISEIKAARARYFRLVQDHQFGAFSVVAEKYRDELTLAFEAQQNQWERLLVWLSHR